MKAPIFLATLAVMTVTTAPAGAQLLKLLSPGDLTTSHQTIDDCGACHQTVKEVTDGKCLDCHTVLDKQLRARRGTHHPRRKQRCVACHQDHKGRDFDSMHVSKRHFDHDPTDFPLTGQHKSVQCEGCHKEPKTYRGLASECGSCHADSHKGALGAECAGCHSTKKDWSPTRAKGDHKLAMTDSHAPLDCVQCHAGGAHLEPSNTCKSCHDDPHRGNAETCTVCHSPTTWKDVRFDHDTCALGLTGRHKTVECETCHKDWQFGGIPENCKGCHDDRPKHGDLGECGRCHDTTSFTKNTFKHQKSKFPLTGKHEVVDCRHCHTSGKFNDLKGKGAGQACLDCHTDVPKHGDFGNCAPCHDTTNAVSFDHGGEDRPTTMPVRAEGGEGGETAVVVDGFPLRGRHVGVTCVGCHRGVAKLGAAVQECAKCHADDDPHDGQFGERAAACADCHVERSFSPSTVTAKGHAPQRFPLEGKHAGVACADCHDRGRFVGAPTACEGCHLDRHAGRLGEACADCHDTAGWPAAAETFAPKHDTLLSFKLRGAHAEVPCADCHVQGRQFTEADGEDCGACHDDPHGGALGAVCGRCHISDTKDWSDRAPFDHRAEADFPLTASHSVLPCADCHVPGGAPADEIDGDCAPCHADPHGGATATACDECHAPHTWDLTTFNHSTTGWPLKGAHLVAACGSCHANQSFTGRTTDCADCHAAQRPADHLFPSWQCGDCHRPTTWMASTFDHLGDTGWALKGAHAAAGPGACDACHTSEIVSTECGDCHAAQRPADHLFPAAQCGDCHRPTTWMASTFDHARDAGWGLKGAHAALAAPGNCDRCHALEGSPASATCGECHAEGAEHFWMSDACGDCHQPTHWSHVSKIGGFLASTHTGFGADTGGLRGAHAVADCASCHLSEGTTMGGGQSCADCHSMPAAPAHGAAWTECHDCHDPFPGWPAKRGWRQHMPASMP